MRIVGGELGPGDPIPGEIAFCEGAGVSRGAYREAVRMIAAKGLVVSRTRTGTRVAPRENWNLLDPDIVRWFFVAGRPPDYFIEGLYELRAVVEPQAAAFAAERRTDADLESFEEALTHMHEQPVGGCAWREADSLFHLTLLRATANPVLLALASGIQAAVAYTTEYKYHNLRGRRNPVEEHREVFERIRGRDAEGARRLMADLVLTAQHETLITRGAAE